MSKKEELSNIKAGLMRRCYDPNCALYKCYGLKGIKVCDEWHDLEKFKEWAFSNGFNGTQRIERIDTTKDYCPENCRIVPKKPVMGKDITKHPLYKRYKSMRRRCSNPKDPNYSLYGGRGIKVCDEWTGKGGAERFISWAIDSVFSENIQIDRIDTNGDYSPENCRWVTQEKQQQNRRGVTICNYGGEKTSINKIARDEGISVYKLKHLLSMLDIEMYTIE